MFPRADCFVEVTDQLERNYKKIKRTCVYKREFAIYNCSIGGWNSKYLFEETGTPKSTVNSLLKKIQPFGLHYMSFRNMGYKKNFNDFNLDDTINEK